MFTFVVVVVVAMAGGAILALLGWGPDSPGFWGWMLLCLIAGAVAMSRHLDRGGDGGDR